MAFGIVLAVGTLVLETFGGGELLDIAIPRKPGLPHQNWCSMLVTLDFI